ncbi:Short-chain dehydrogenase [Daejeonella rubra]|uniref:Short-chain dehydrogenase n=1 Tax=Daejeonella rubra TaxID=990371 RepID=A0A1G9TNJ8_9SPHI|nr:oxidoreductase [Daejeonella rubra]SDM49263.1 Short-chain dehydrogenase [Daejeonella rubra]
MNNSTRIWLITGVSGGLGRALALEAAQNGDIVYGTLRKNEQLEAFNELVPGKTFGVILDVNQHQNIATVLTDILEHQGRLDVLVNNAGYGLFGAIEELSMEEARQQMETNFFSVLALTQAVLPIMRKQRSGHILQISSMSGIRAYSGTGLYNASKFALEGMSEALSAEIKPLNIHLTLIEPGPFRTDWAGASSVRAKKSIDDYKASSGDRLNLLQSNSGKQPGDPVKGAKAMLKVVNSENPPLRLVLGKPALDAIREKYKMVEEELKAWEDITLNTSFDQ